jgi:hypothetical protein
MLWAPIHLPALCRDTDQAADTQWENRVPPSRPAIYRSYLLRCWKQPRGGQRFVLETVSGAPQQQGFERFEDFVTYLRAELMAGADDQSGGQATQMNSDHQREGGHDE